MFNKLQERINKVFLNGLLLYRQRILQDKNCVIFIATAISPRIVKIGYALKKKGFRVIIFLQRKNIDMIGIYDVNKSDLYDRLYLFDNEKALYLLCLKFKPLVYHIFSGGNVEDWVVFLIKNKKNIGKIVYDQYDIYRDMYAEKDMRIIKNEKFSLENADGLICRSFQTQYLKNKYKYHFKGRRLLFFDYCWNNRHVSKHNKQDYEKLSIVYGGRLLPRRSNNILSHIEWEGLSYWIETTKKYSAKMVVIACNINNNSEYREFFRLTRKNPNFILKGKMNFNDLITYESKMDYGTDTFELGKDQKSNFKNFNFLARETYCATNKYFDYIDAGIPIICGRPTEMLGRYLEKYGIVFRCTLEELPEKMNELKQRRNEYAKNVIKARKELGIEKQIPRLVNFYKQLYKD